LGCPSESAMWRFKKNNQGRGALSTKKNDEKNTLKGKKRRPAHPKSSPSKGRTIPNGTQDDRSAEGKRVSQKIKKALWEKKVAGSESKMKNRKISSWRKKGAKTTGKKVLRPKKEGENGKGIGIFREKNERPLGKGGAQREKDPRKGGGKL